MTNGANILYRLKDGLTGEPPTGSTAARLTRFSAANGVSPSRPADGSRAITSSIKTSQSGRHGTLTVRR